MSEMKYFKEGNIESGYGQKGIILGERILSISVQKGKVVFTEECDGYYSEEFIKDEAIELLQEAISWIQKNS